MQKDPQGADTSLRVAKFVRIWYDIFTAPLRPDNGKEVNPMENLCSFFLSILASVVANLLCGWLDRKGKGR